MYLIYIIFYIIVFYLLFDFVKKNLNKFEKLSPPSPRFVIPLFGHLHLFGINPHRSLTDLAKRYGPIYSIWMGNVPTMVITDPVLVREIWVKQFSNFSNRPHPKSFKNYSNNFRDLAFADYELWSINRKLVSSCFTKTKIKSVYDKIENQTNNLIKSMNTFSGSSLFYPKKYFSKFAINIVCGMMFSKEIEPDESVDIGTMAKLTVPIQMVFKKLGADNLDDYIGIFSPFYYLSNLKFKKQIQDIYEFMESIYDDHIDKLNKDNPKDLMDLLINATQGNEKKTVIHIGMDFLLAGSDSNAAVIEWFCLYMINNQDIQLKAYNELIKVIKSSDSYNGNISSISIKERDNCEYMVAIIKELLRIRPIGPMGIPRIASCDTMVNGYLIPKGTQVIQNIFGMGNLFVKDGDKFKPERWIEYKKQKELIDYESFNYFDDLDKVCIPYSIGKRNCCGISLSESVLFSACSNILLNFKLNSIDGNPLNETEVFGLTIHTKTNPIKLSPRI